MDYNISSQLKEFGLSEYEEQIIDKLLPAVRFESSGLDDDNSLPVGVSKIGGIPDLPVGMQWPLWKDAPLSFLVQINLAELAKFPFIDELPKHGLLSFFYAAEEQPWGFDPKNKDGWKVLYIDEPSANLIRKEQPGNMDEEKQFQSSAIRFSSCHTLPSPGSQFCMEIGFSDTEMDSYIDMLDKIQEGSCHRLFGHPAQIQGDMQVECQLVSNGLSCGDNSGYDDPRRAELLKGIEDWMLLLQLGSDEIAEMMWGDYGRLYFWIRKQDLKEQRFEKSWMILQCH